MVPFSVYALNLQEATTHSSICCSDGLRSLLPGVSLEGEPLMMNCFFHSFHVFVMSPTVLLTVLGIFGNTVRGLGYSSVPASVPEYHIRGP
jgi:hypothetical protein